MSDVTARWESVARAVAIRDNVQNPRGDASWITLIIGNGDVEDIADARKKSEETKCDGVMLGRAIFGNPWLFSHSQECENVLPQEKIRALSEHLTLFDELLSGNTSYATMKKHFKSYISGWNGAKELRLKLMETGSVGEAATILQNIL